MITADQVTALTAQAAANAYVDPYDADGNLLPDWQLNNNGDPIYLGAEISTRGIGIYGQTPSGLTLTGYLKPGTLSLITSPALTITVLNTPAVWTGLNGITSLLDYLNDPISQNLAQIDIMTGAFQGLLDAGILVGNETAKFQATFLQPATRYGVNAVLSWVNDTASTDLVNNILIVARQAQYAIDFVDSYASLLNVSVDVPGFENTILREELDLAVTDIIGNPKVPSIDYVDNPVTIAGLGINAGANVLGTTNEDGTFRFAPGKPKA
jgi:hypothetical protein